MKFMRIFFICAIFQIALFASQNNGIYQNLDANKPEIISRDSKSIKFNWKLNNFEIKENQINGDILTRIIVPNSGYYGKTGDPEIPVIGEIVAIPNKGDVAITYNIIEEDVLHNVKMYPTMEMFSNSDPNKKELEFNSSIYQSKQAYPEKIVTRSEPMILRNIRVLPISFAPVRYYPESGDVKIARSVEINIEFLDTPGKNEKESQQNVITESFASIYKSIPNSDFILENSEIIRGSYLIITPDPYYGPLVQLVNWKRKLGYNVVISKTSEVGNSPNQVYDYIQNAYNTYEIPLEYVLLIGDVDGSYPLGTHYYAGDCTDHPYSTVDGDDYLSDIFVGRLSADNVVELNVMVQKIIKYESSPYMSNTTWFRSALNVSSYYHAESIKFLMRWVRELMMSNGYVQVDTCIYPDQSSASQVPVSVNNGVGFVNYRGWAGAHGWYEPPFYVEDIEPYFSNGFKTPIVSSIVCGTMDYASSTDPCFGEEWMRAGTPTNPKGSVGYFGCSEFNQNVRFANIIDMAFYWTILKEDVSGFGAAVLRSKLEVLKNFPHMSNPGGTVEFYFNIYGILGDPALSMWSKVPQPLDVVFPSTIHVGSNFIEVEVSSSNQPVEDAYICLSQNNGQSLFKGGYTNSGGKINFPLQNLLTSNINLTVSKPNCHPKTAVINVTSAGAYCGLSGYEIDDDSNGESNGNGNGIIEAGEVIEIFPIVKNFGTANAENVYGILSVDDEYLTILSDSISIGSIASGLIVTSDNPLIIEVNSSCPDEYTARFNFEVKDISGNSWNSDLLIMVSGLILKIEDSAINDAGGDGNAGPGENCTIFLSLKNTGTILLTDVTAQLTTTNEDIVIDNEICVFDTIFPQQIVKNDSNLYTFFVNEKSFPGTKAEFDFQITSAEGLIMSHSLELEIGTPGKEDPTGPDQYGYYAFGSNDIEYSMTKAYDWIEIDPNYGGNGTIIPLNDYSEGGDKSKIINCPFIFSFYGGNFMQITVCSNGWLAAGTSSEVNPRNWDIPSPPGPNSLIAPFWDDLRLSSGSGTGKVYQYFDEANHRFIIEWSRTDNEYDNHTEETFQVIIFDQNYYLTETGDSEILFQYKEINDIDSYDNYSTVGIQKAGHEIGLKYVYSNIYPTTAKELSDHSTIFFTTNKGIKTAPPAIASSPSSLDFILPENTESEKQVVISNTGGANLSYSADIMYQKSADNDHPNAQGGPDNFGYFWYDSDNPDGPEFDWVDIISSENRIYFTNDIDDESIGPFDLGFSMPFYGVNFGSVNVCSNGFLSFNSNSTECQNQYLPSNDAPKNLLAVFWDDLNGEDGLQGENYFWTNEVDTAIVSYINTPHWGNTGPYTFQLILTKSGKITFQYLEVNSPLNSHTIGIQNNYRNDGLTVAHNDPNYVHNNLAVCFVPPSNWASIAPANGIIQPGWQDTLTISVNSEEAEFDYNLANVVISNNSENAPLINIPLSLSISHFGDINFDELVNVLDVVKLVRFVVGTEIAEESEFYASDMNEDGVLNVQDIVLLVYMILERSEI